MKGHVLYLIVGIIIAFSGCSHDDETVINVMTLNLRYDNPDDSLNSWPNRIPLVSNFIPEEEPDIIGMQEVLWHQYVVLDSILTDYNSVGVGRNDGAKSGEMNPVFFKKDKFDMVRTITFWLSDSIDVPGSKGWGASLPRIVTWIELVEKASHQHFFFFNTHFAHDSDSARIMSSGILIREVEKIANGYPFIITGDFNMLPDNEGYAILTGPNESVPLIKDSYFISRSKPDGPSYTFNGFSDKPGRGRIDYIFVRNGLEVEEHRTFQVKKDDIFISDHWPVQAQVLISEPKKGNKK